ncbi:MAG: RHS repeat-associated core domain-containing protein [Bacteroidales bacterium]|nr:RHS repeat-associated core domain-containing protein [Bacteroidales bacterium]
MQISEDISIDSKRGLLKTEKCSFQNLENTDDQSARFSYNTTAFTGKERDEETGYSYFGARYYDSDLSGLFLSVDPMADKYPSLSPYAYCAWNPVKLVDPDGMDTIVSINIHNGNIKQETTEKYTRGCIVNFLDGDNGNSISEYPCNGYVYSYKNGGVSVIDFGDDSDAESVYNQLSGRTESSSTSSVEWNYYKNKFNVPSQLITSNKRDEIDVFNFCSLGGLTQSVRHYQPYYSDLDYSIPSPEDILYARIINIPCYLDYCGKSYRFDNVIPNNFKNPTSGIIRYFVKSKILNYEPYCKQE